MDLNLKDLFFILSVICLFAGFIPYCRDVLKRKTQPHIYTWLIWFVTQATATVGVWYGDGGLAAVSLSISTFLVLVIFILSFWYGTKNIKKIDTIIFALTIIAVVIWWNVQSLLLAVIMVSGIDFFGYFPSFRKTFEEPWSETLLAYFIYALSNIFTILSLSEYNLTTVTYLAVIGIANMIMVFLMLTRRPFVVKPF